ncbi:hypothetical protein HPB52_005932 [Rhipicephalus sanguineus]|uniref:Uncharacterized protein n=1 Tax=Rhipicephalus sanguineus TaxID=34632 RepID=A0A9D4SNI6_RHISA|nr:hypothetical protein HPB52_005932 [Rhipicephalus sanguineus]
MVAGLVGVKGQHQKPSARRYTHSPHQPPPVGPELIVRSFAREHDRYDRLKNSGPVSATAVAAVTTPDERSLRQRTQEIVQEEQKKLVAAPNDCAILSVTEVVRQEIRQALSLREPNSDTIKPTYVDIVRRQPSNEPSSQQYHKQQSSTSPWYYRETLTPMRSPDYRLLCFHCGEAGYPGFPSTTTRRYFNGRPNIDTSMTTSRDDSPGCVLVGRELSGSCKVLGDGFHGGGMHIFAKRIESLMMRWFRSANDRTKPHELLVFDADGMPCYHRLHVNGEAKPVQLPRLFS